MKKNSILWILVLLCLSNGAHAKTKRVNALQRPIYQIAKADHPVTDEKPFVILTLSYNNKQFYEKNLKSILDQDYSNYRVIYIDDCSTDGMSEKVQGFLKEYDTENRVSYIRNKTNRGPPKNHYDAVHSCNNDEIIVVVDGDDFLAHPQVLNRLNTYYANPAVWLTYGDFAEYPSLATGKKRKHGGSYPIDWNASRGIRTPPFISSHLRTYYAGLFKQIKLQDFFINGKFGQAAADLISMYPMLEMSTKEHAFFIPEVLYLYNTGNPISEFQIVNAKQMEVFHSLTKYPTYKPLTIDPTASYNSEIRDAVDLIVFSYNRPLQLYAFLESAQKHMIGNYQIKVVYRANGEPYDQGYQEVKVAFPTAEFIQQSSTPYEDFAPIINKLAFDQEVSQNAFVLFAVDDIIIKDCIDLPMAVKSLKDTKAYGFYFRLGTHVDYSYVQNFKQGVPQLIEMGNGIYAWQFSGGKGDWAYPNNVDMTLYKKADIKRDLESINFRDPNTLEGHWAMKQDLRKVGLCLESSRIVNLPCNRVEESGYNNRLVSSPLTTAELLELFQKGYKIDIEDLKGFKNSSAHCEHPLKFIWRTAEQ